VLRTQLHQRRTETLRRGWRDPQPLFPSTAGTYADPSKMRAAFRRVCRAAGLVTDTGQAKHTPHSLRHTYAALHLQLGTDVYYVSRQLGHADISLTVGTYGAWLQPTRRAAVDALDRVPATPTEAQA
jgi:integrase